MNTDALNDQIAAAIALIDRHGQMPDVNGIVEALMQAEPISLRQYAGRVLDRQISGQLAALRALLAEILAGPKESPPGT